MEVANEYQIKVQEYQVKVKEENDVELPAPPKYEYYEQGIEEAKDEAEEFEKASVRIFEELGKSENPEEYAELPNGEPKAELKEELETMKEENFDENEVDLTLSTTQNSQEQGPDLDSRLHDRVTYAVWAAIIAANHQHKMDDGDIPGAFDKAWSVLTAEQKDKLNEEYKMDLGSETFAKFIHLKEADPEVYEELRNELLSLGSPAKEASSDDEEIEFEVSLSHNHSNDSDEGSDFDDAEIEIEADNDFNNNSEADESVNLKEVESTGPTDEESDGEEDEKGNVSDYSFEDISITDITEREMPGDAKAEGSKDEMKRQKSSPPHVLPKHMAEWSKEMEDRYENIAHMQSETLKQMLALQIKVDNYTNPAMNSEAQKKMLALKIRVEKELNPRSFKRPRDDYEDAE